MNFFVVVLATVIVFCILFISGDGSATCHTKCQVHVLGAQYRQLPLRLCALEWVRVDEASKLAT